MATELSEMRRITCEERLHAIIVDCCDDYDAAIELCWQFKSDDATEGVPIATLLSPGDAHRFVKLIKAGVEDSFVRPLMPDKLLQFLRGISPADDDVAQYHPKRTVRILRKGHFEINLDAHYATFKRRRLDLGPIGFRLLFHLLQYPNCVHSREELVDVAWPDGESTDLRAVDVHLSRLRKALKTGPGRRCPIKTVRSCGYLLEVKSVP
ncbi:response regulator transcription factor [Phyllobacterium sp. SB3]|uniref:winged helix-turn-helix transcriptional regulator n=1 Tax=Phyllobacterium sp. SB3 TaxID=3156073 RepID=UPI0032AF07C1